MDSQLSKKERFDQLLKNPLLHSIWIVFVVIILVWQANAVPQVQVPDSLMVHVRNDLFNRSTNVIGVVQPQRKILVSSVTGGKVKQLFKQAGELVEQGEPIIEVSNPILELEVLTREAEVSQQISNLSNINLNYLDRELQYKLDQENFEREIDKTKAGLVRLERLHKTEYVSEEMLEDAKRLLKSSENNLSHLLSSFEEFKKIKQTQTNELGGIINNLKSSMVVAQNHKDDLIVKSPESGRIASLEVNEGEYLQPGTLVSEIETGSAKVLKAYMDEFLRPEIREGMVGTTTIKGRPVELKLSRIFPVVEDNKLKVDFIANGNQLNNIPIGSTRPISIKLAKESMLLIPNKDYLSIVDNKWVFVVDESLEYASKREIRLGKRNAEFVQVLSGLSENEIIFIGNYEELIEYDQFKLQ